jgi:hypothetical protein
VLPAAALWSAVLGAAVLLEAEPAWQDSEIIFTLSTLKLLSGCKVPVSCTVLPLFALKSLVLPLSL